MQRALNAIGHSQTDLKTKDRLVLFQTVLV